MNSVIKITDDCAIDVMIVRAISWNPSEDDDQEGAISVWFMRHDLPLVTSAKKEDYMNFYTKWRNHTQWRLNLAMGEYENA